jgi:hypothetical protein
MKNKKEDESFDTPSWRWRKSGFLKSTKIGGRVYYKEADLLTD